MRWLQSWLRTTADNFGPRCTDGTLLREIPFTKHCDEQDLNNIAENIPGCEIESVPISNGNIIIENKINFSYYIILIILVKTETSNKVNSWTNNEESNENKPLPEETDYFYDDVVDLNEKTEYQRGFSTEKSLSTIPPAILSHYVPGDTPTLYASTRSNSSSVNNDHPLQNNPATGTDFTFFGVPIPPLNFNNIWGQTKGTGKRLKDSRRNSLPKKSSAIEQDGFTPILPGTGGFRPMMTTSDHNSFQEETENEDEIDIVYRNNSSSNTILGFRGSSRYHSSTTETPFHYDRFPSSEYSYSKFPNITTRDSLFESATINSIIRSTVKPSFDNSQQQSAASATILQSNDSLNQSENLSKLSTGNT